MKKMKGVFASRLQELAWQADHLCDEIRNLESECESESELFDSFREIISVCEIDRFTPPTSIMLCKRCQIAYRAIRSAKP